MNVDVTHQVTREVRARGHEGQSRRAVVVNRTFGVAPEILWDAITRPERLADWFGVVVGELRLGGRFEIEGVAKGGIRACASPASLAVTWEAYGDVGWVQAELSGAPEGGTLLRVEHVLSGRLFDRLHWWWYGAGATGLGWELWLLGLEQHLAGAVGEGSAGGTSSAEVQRWQQTAEGKAYLQRASEDWCRAEIAWGTRPATASKRAARACAFYGRLAAR